MSDDKKTELKPNEELKNGQWIYSDDHRYRFGVKDNKAVVERVDPSGDESKNVVVNKFGEVKDGDNARLRLQDENWLGKDGRELRLIHSAASEDEGSTEDKIDKLWVPKDGEPDWNDEDALFPDKLKV